MTHVPSPHRWLLLLVALAAIASYGCDRGPVFARGVSREPGPIPRHGSVVRIDPSTGRVLAAIPVGPDPLLMEVASGFVWTLNLGDGSRTRIDPATNRAVTVDDGTAVGMTSDGTDVWLAVGSTTLQRVDGATGVVRASLELGDQPLFELRDAGFLGVVRGDVWITIPDLRDANAPQQLWHVDPSSGDIVATLEIGPNPMPLLADRPYLWVIQTTPAAGWLTRIDVDSGRTIEVPTGSLPGGMAVGAGSLWVGDAGEENVRRIDRRSGETLARVPLDQDPRGIGFGDGLVWVSGEMGVTAIDPATNRPVRSVDLITPVTDEGPTALAFADGSIWVSIE